MILPFAMLGTAAGATHFVAIWREADRIVRGGSPFAALGLRFGRALPTVAALVAAAQEGWPALLGATGGFMVARQIVLHHLRAMSP